MLSSAAGLHAAGLHATGLHVVCAMSGGVDSTVAAALQIQQGFKCTGITLKLRNEEIGCSSLQDINDAKAAANNLGIEHLTFDLSKEFNKYVVSHFVETYENGATPNPCIECNKNIKFNMQFFQSSFNEFDFFVTGHYARITKDPISGRFLLQKAIDEKKDQSYVLYCLTQQQLEKASFPLGSLTKTKVRKLAEEKKLINAAKSESQDICFIPDGDYGSFIERFTGKTYPYGDIIDLEGNVLGRHKGLIRYTIGQRRGLGVAANKPIYVVSKSTSANTVTLAADEALYTKSLTAENINLITCDDIKKSMRVLVKTRYQQVEQWATAEQTGENSLHIEFDLPQRAITPGQAVVMYDGDTVVGGGTIV
ncbi:MAG: tRNA 2-thiouridine(34) synthase MnmA [Treponema sp.]|nr:tRNA 2-thiouridine(34) synthase MnmA [Treponema sp.]